MTANETTPAHAVQALAAALASAGVAALASIRAFGHRPLLQGENLTSVYPHLPAVLALVATATVAAVIATSSLRRAGGWLVLAAVGILALLAFSRTTDRTPEQIRVPSIY